MDLFDAAGAQLPRAFLTLAMGSVYQNANGSIWPAVNCNDGSSDTICHTNNTDPTLTVKYPCAGGATSLSKVRVTNWLDACCQSRLTSFSLDFLNATGGKDRASYKFEEARPTYSISPEGAQPQGLPAAALQ